MIDLEALLADGEAQEEMAIESVITAIRAKCDAIPRPERNAENMAKATHAALREVCAEWGMNPDVETVIRAPGEEAYDGAGNRWLVAWESGPYQWAIPASMALGYGLTEPYFSFDLNFYPAEDYTLDPERF